MSHVHEHEMSCCAGEQPAKQLQLVGQRIHMDLTIELMHMQHGLPENGVIAASCAE